METVKRFRLVMTKHGHCWPMFTGEQFVLDGALFQEHAEGDLVRAADAKRLQESERYAWKNTREIDAERQGMLRAIQRHQPAGSPPPGDGEALAIWVLDSLETRIQGELQNYAGAVNTVMKLRDCLERLVDYQNGCPLPSYEQEWTRAMTDAAVLLGRSAPSASGEQK